MMMPVKCRYIQSTMGLLHSIKQLFSSLALLRRYSQRFWAYAGHGTSRSPVSRGLTERSALVLDVSPEMVHEEISAIDGSDHGIT
jgi:hypothetical protein